MTRKVILTCGLIWIGVIGCRRDNVPTPPKHSEVMKDESGRSYQPVRIPDRKGDTVFGRIAAPEQVAAAEKRDSGETVRIDDSTPEALAKSLCDLSASADWRRLADLLIAEQSDTYRAIEEPLTPFLRSVSRFVKSSREKFEGHSALPQVQDAWLARLLDLTTITELSQAEPAGEEESRIILTAGPAEAEDAKKIELTAKQTDGAWRISLADFHPPESAETVEAALEGKSAAFDGLAGRITNNEIRDVDEARDEADKIMEESVPPAADGEPNAGTDENAE